MNWARSGRTCPNVTDFGEGDHASSIVGAVMIVMLGGTRVYESLGLCNDDHDDDHGYDDDR